MKHCQCGYLLGMEFCVTYHEFVGNYTQVWRLNTNKLVSCLKILPMIHMDLYEMLIITKQPIQDCVCLEFHITETAVKNNIVLSFG